MIIPGEFFDLNFNWIDNIKENQTSNTADPIWLPKQSEDICLKMFVLSAKVEIMKSESSSGCLQIYHVCNWIVQLRKATFFNQNLNKNIGYFVSKHEIHPLTSCGYPSLRTLYSYRKTFPNTSNIRMFRGKFLDIIQVSSIMFDVFANSMQNILL